MSTDNNDLFPTKTRLALLADVLAGSVYERSDGTSVNIATDQPRTVTAAIDELSRAGWVRVGQSRMSGRKPWHLTASGTTTLEAHTKGAGR